MKTSIPIAFALYKDDDKRNYEILKELDPEISKLDIWRAGVMDRIKKFPNPPKRLMETIKALVK